MENFWRSIKNLWKKLWQILSNTLKRKKNYLKAIERTIEDFRFMSDEEQGKYFVKSLGLIRDNLEEGDFDGKIHIKYQMRFFKIIKTTIFAPRSDIKKHIELRSVYTQAFGDVKAFINELRGVEKNKEDNFLNILNHENKANFNNMLMVASATLYETIGHLNDKASNFDKLENHGSRIKDIFKSLTNNIKNIIGETMQKITEQEKIDKLKVSSEIFTKKAKKYRYSSFLFLGLAALLTASVFYIVFFKEVFNYDIVLPPKNSIDGSAFYIYLILEVVFRGRLLFSIITLAGFLYCLRFYAANNHNAIICDQRSNSLEFFEGLYENAKGEKERLLVVEKVLNSATEHLPTGFSKQQSDNGGEGIVSSLASLLKR